MTDEITSLLRRVEELQNTIADITTELAEIRNYLESKMLTDMIIALIAERTWKEKRMKRDLTQLNRVEQYLKDKGIPYERFDKEDVISPQLPYYLETFERHQICVPNSINKEWDVICHKGSYGAEGGLLEIYGSIVAPNAGDSVEGWLTADDVIERIERRRE